MPLSIKLLRRRCTGPLNTVTYANIADNGLARIENLHVLPKVESLILRGNDISLVQNLLACHHLWHLDLANNQVTNLDGLSKFVALGTLNLSLNNISWNDLRHIRHMYILELSLHGNPKLDRDPYYRIHATDCLPNVWMLDGRLITSAERVQVQHFFQETALSGHPVRHKLPKDQFVPSTLKKIQVHGIYGNKTTHFMMRFPTNGALNISTDWRRLMYLAYNLQEDMATETQQAGRPLQCKEFMEQLLGSRSMDRERCNVLLLLLVASMEFSLPPTLLEDTLAATKLRDIIDGFDSLELFFMPEGHQCRILSLLLSAVKVDRDDHKDGGLYDKLYLCLYYTVAELVKRHSIGSNKNTAPIDRTNPIYREYRSLLASEVIQLLCIVPSFYIYLNKDASISHLVTQATGSASTMDGVEGVMERINSSGGGSHRTIEEVSEYLMECIQRHTKNVLHKKISPNSSSNYVLETPRALPKRPQSSPVYASGFMAVGQPSPVTKPFSRPNSSRLPGRSNGSRQPRRPNTASTTRSSPSEHRPGSSLSTSSSSSSSRLLSLSRSTPSAGPQGGRCRYPKQQETWSPAKPPELGDKVLLGPQNLAYIIALPEYDVALLQLEAIPVPNGSVVSFSRNPEEHYAYMNMVHMEWDSRCRYWKPIGAIGDRITLNTIQLDGETKPPPSSPTSSISPRSALQGDDETETTHHPTPRDSNENLPQPISLRFREKLQLSPEKITPIEEEQRGTREDMRLDLGEDEHDDDEEEDEEEEGERGPREGSGGEDDHQRNGDGENWSQDSTQIPEGGYYQSRQGEENDTTQLDKSPQFDQNDTTLTEILSARMREEKKVDPLHEHHPDKLGDDSLYNCLRCAMKTIKINTDASSPPNTPTESVADDSRRPTERALNASLVSQVAEANQASQELITVSVTRKSRARPSTAPSDSVQSRRGVRVVDLNIWPEPGLYTDYQRERTKEWDRTLKRPKSSASVRSLGTNKSHSRASSAKTRASTPSQRDSQASPLLIQTGNHWLAGGRDVASWERITNRMKTYYMPGWRDGSANLPRRPKSVGPYKYSDVASWERITNRMKTYYMPGWRDGSAALPRRPKSVGPYKYRPRGAMHRRVRSAVGPRERDYLYQDVPHPPPSPASTDFSQADLEAELYVQHHQQEEPPSSEPSYLHQAHQHNFTSPSSISTSSFPPRPHSVSLGFGAHRPATPPFGGPKKPASPLQMTVKFL